MNKKLFNIVSSLLIIIFMIGSFYLVKNGVISVVVRNVVLVIILGAYLLGNIYLKKRSS